MSGLFGGGGGGSVQAPNPPKPLQIKIPQMEKQMVAADQAAYAQGDQYMQQFYPSLWNAQQGMIGQAYQNLTGPLDPSLQNTFMTNANVQSANALGGGNSTFGFGGGSFGGAGAGSSWGGEGSLARNAAAANVAQNVQGYETYNQGFMNQLNTLFAPRTFGGTPEDLANMFTFNNTQYNNYLNEKFAGQTQAYYQNQGLAAGQSASTTGSILSIVGSIAAAY